ncbi:MAG TPA: hypothetical protein VFO00_01015 [Vitreimonas sp.]|nr:hypothetical protein [Vitreimonas sp.]
MFRRHWLTLLVAAVFAYFGIAAAPVLVSLADEPQTIIAAR